MRKKKVFIEIILHSTSIISRKYFAHRLLAGLEFTYEEVQ